MKSSGNGEVNGVGDSSATLLSATANARYGKNDELNLSVSSCLCGEKVFK